MSRNQIILLVEIYSRFLIHRIAKDHHFVMIKYVKIILVV